MTLMEFPCPPKSSRAGPRVRSISLWPARRALALKTVTRGTATADATKLRRQWHPPVAASCQDRLHDAVLTRMIGNDGQYPTRGQGLERRVEPMGNSSSSPFTAMRRA